MDVLKIAPIMLVVLFLVSSVIAQEEPTNLAIEEISISDITESSAIITASTNRESTINVEYGETTELGDEQSQIELLLTHQIMLTNLRSSTDYYFVLTACSDDGQCVSSGTYSFITSESITEEEINEEIEELGQSLSEVISADTSQKIAKNKHSGAPIVTINGLYQVYNLKQPKKIFILSSSKNKVLPHIVELIEIGNKNIKLRIDGTEYNLDQGQKNSFDIDDDGVYDAEATLLFVKPRSARLLFKSTNKVINKDGVTFDEEEIFELPEEYLEILFNEEDSDEEFIDKDRKNNNLLWYGLLIIGVVVLFYFVNKKKGKKSTD